MAVRIGGRELAQVYSAAVRNGRDGPFELQEFRRAIREETGEDPEYGDPSIWELGRINEADEPWEHATFHPRG